MKRFAKRFRPLVWKQTTLFASLLKWTALATVVGVITGVSTALFLRTLGWASGWSPERLSEPWRFRRIGLARRVIARYRHRRRTARNAEASNRGGTRPATPSGGAPSNESV
jgi:hypothetical protein